jgi:quinol monooxygenase YgiN
MIIVSGEIGLDAAKAAQVMDAAKAMMAETRKEDGCISYCFYQSLEDPGVFRVFEEWESLDHLKAHFEAPHMGAWRAALGEIGITRRDIKRYEVASAESL